MNLPAGFEVFLGLKTDFLFVGSGLRRSTRPQSSGGSRPGGAIALMSEPRGDRRPLGKDPETACKEEERTRSEEHTSELQSRLHLVCRLLLEKKNLPRGGPETLTPCARRHRLDD